MAKISIQPNKLRHKIILGRLLQFLLPVFQIRLSLLALLFDGMNQLMENRFRQLHRARTILFLRILIESDFPLSAFDLAFDIADLQFLPVLFDGFHFNAPSV